ncbi:MAG: hypothetical protein HYX78_05680 [Armatimonadetes bacterium]|nr:hypothetical protein [Armatimonadota bacterium]
MSLILDSCVIIDLNILDERDPKYKRLEIRTDGDACYITPIEASEVCYRLRKDIDSTLAELVLDAMQKGEGPRIVDLSAVIPLAADARAYGVPPSIAFNAALAKNLDGSVLVGSDYPEKVDAYRKLGGFCRIEVY